MHKLGSRATATRGSRIEEAAVLDHFREELIYLPGNSTNVPRKTEDGSRTNLTAPL